MTYDEVLSILRGRRRESLSLDYKADLNHGVRSQDLAKDVAAFANTAGGVLFYGVDARNASEVPETFPGIEATVRGDSVATWYERKLNAVLTPHVDVQCHVLSEGLALPEGRIILAVHVPRSLVGPHMIWSAKEDSKQGKDLQYRYYVRHATESKPATEQEVRAMYGRSFGSPRLYLRPGFLPSLKWRPCVKLLNIGASAARNVHARFMLIDSRDAKVKGAEIEASLRRSTLDSGSDIYAGVLQPGEYYSYLLGNRQYAFVNPGTVMCLVQFQDPYGTDCEEFVICDLRAWIEQVTNGNAWAWELEQASDDDWAEIGRWEPALVQRREVRRSEGPPMLSPTAEGAGSGPPSRGK